MQPVGPVIGRSQPRAEDPYLLTGLGNFVDDIEWTDALDAVFVRSPHAAARIVGVGTDEALAFQGAVEVLTAASFADVGGMRPMLGWDSFVPTTLRPLAADTVRHVGEPVALVVADSPYLAEDAAELVDVRYDPTAAVASVDAAVADGAPLVHDDVPGNVTLDVTVADTPGIDEVLEKADVVVDVTVTSSRQSACPMEGRACAARWSARERKLIVYSSTQIPHLLRTAVAAALGMDEHRVQVIAPDVGGGFGMKCAVSREEIAVAAAAYLLRRPVKWVEDRQESLLSAFQGREQRYVVRAGFSSTGELQGIIADISCDVGAYNCFPFTCAVEVLAAPAQVPGPYRVQNYRGRARGVLTNKPPIAPYRGVSGPQAILAIERLMDKAARALDLDPVEIRRRNVIVDGEFPYHTVTGAVYEQGSYLAALERCAAELDVGAWRERQDRARAEGRLIGIGFSCFVEGAAFGSTAYARRKMDIVPGAENVTVRMDPTGAVEVLVGTHSQGQGHATTYAQLVANELGVDPGRVRVVQGDTDVVPHGWGTFASRSAVIGGSAAKQSAVRLADRLREVAAHLLEAAPDDIELVGGRVGVRGSPGTGLDIGSVARTVYHRSHLVPLELRGELISTAAFDSPGTYSNATHGAVVELSPDTGQVRIERYVVAEDCGVVINPMIVEGQIRGAVTQGIASALYERLVYDEDGQMLTSTLMDYLVPTAHEVPNIEIWHLETPCPTSKTGAKGMAEGGTIGAPAAVINAVNNALPRHAVSLDSIPVLPEVVLSAIEGEHR
ncbi:MAG: molybdopterin-dependent oxidoreductase [Streptosporangiales bacterium]|nr:molybdopterin-dependent oxidoreductase [Streptosporangiales bacterium]